jgi:branched-chain amino acid transport system substrate-binding protein
MVRKQFFLIGMVFPCAALIFSADSLSAMTIKVGQACPLTGEMASYGRDTKKALDLAVSFINSQGGIKSMGGANLVNIYSDSQSRPELAIRGCEGLIREEGAHVITGEIFSFLTVPSTVVAERLKTPYYVPVAAADAMTRRGFKYTFQQSKLGWEWGDAVVPFLLDLKKMGVRGKKAALLMNDTEFAATVAGAAEKRLKEEGFAMVARVDYPTKANDFRPYLAKLDAQNPDIVIRCSSLREAVAFSRLQKTMKAKAPHIGITCGDTTHELINQLGSLGEGMLALNAWNGDLTVTRWFNDLYKEKYGQDIYLEPAAAAQGMFVIWEALEGAGNKVDFDKVSLAEQRDAIREALSQVRLKPGKKIIFPWDGISFDPNHCNTFGGSGGLIIHQVKNGKFVTVWPDQHAVEKIDLKTAGFRAK